MNVIKIILIILVILLIYIVYQLASSSNGKTLITMHDAKSSDTIIGEDVPSSTSPHDTGYSFWAVVDNWEYNYGVPKIIFQTGKDATTFSPKVFFEGTTNNIIIKTKTKKKENECIVEDIPIQKWFNIIISYNNKALDVYMDGKLVKTCLIEGDIEDYQGQNIILTPDTGTETGSFDGFLAKFKKFGKAVTPREAWSTYKEGYTKGGFLGVLNTFGLKMEVTKSGKTMTGFEI
tara:strand:- start:3513 stop:4211 length:699 start_codon:yes stop_codon:yes gene_type:complete